MLKKSKGKNRSLSKSPTQIVSDSIRDDDESEKEYRTFGRKSEESRKSYSSKTPESQDSVLFNFRFDNANFSRRDSKESTVGSSQDEELALVSKSILEKSKRRKKMSVEESDLDEIHCVMLTTSNKSGTSSAQKSDKRYKSHDSLEKPSENLLLKKTEEVTNFNVGIFGSSNVMNENGMKHLADRITSELPERKLNSGVFGEVEPFRRELKISMVNERDTIDSSRDHFVKNDKRTRSSIPLRSYEGLLKRSNVKCEMENEEEKVNQDSISRKYVFSRNRLVNYFFEKCENFSKRSKFTQMNVVEEKSKRVEENVIEPEVTWQEDLEIKANLQEIYFYLIFLIFVTTIALSMVSSNMYYFTEMTVELFLDTPNVPSYNKTGNVSDMRTRDALNARPYPVKTLRHSNTFGDFWAFAESTMIDMFYWNFYYSHMDPVIHTAEDDKKMFFENQILGVPRIRQVRVRNDSCEIHPDVKRFFVNCYYYYSIFSEETRPIKEGMEGSSTASAWVYTEAKDLNTSYYWGEISIYGGGGYYLDFSSNKNETINMVKELKKNLWVSRATRAIFIDFNLYNANVNLFCICKIILEFPPVGGMIPKADFHSLKLIRYLSTFDFFILGLEFVFLLFIVYYTIKEVFIIKKQKVSFFFYFWNYIDLLILLLSYIYIILSIVVYIYTTELVSTLSDRHFEYTEFSLVKDLQINYNNVIAVLLFTCWFKLFKYLNFNTTMVEFKKTLSRSLRDIFAFFPMFLTIFLAFALLAYLLFGNQVKSYNTVWLSFLALLQAFLGEFEYDQIQESNRVLGPIFYIALIFFIFFVLLNVFIAIINDAYASVKSEVISDTPKIGDYCKRGFLNFLGFSCCKLDKKLEKKSKIKKKKLYDDIKRALKNAGFSDLEIEIFFSKYNINVNNILDEKARRKIIEDLELKRIDFSENAEQFQISSLRRRIDNLNERIEDIEVSLQPVIDKVDIILNRL